MTDEIDTLRFTGHARSDSSQLYRIFALSLVERSVNHIRMFCDRRKRGGVPGSVMKRAIAAYCWLTGTAPARITFAEVCDGVNLDSAWVRKQLFSQFDVDTLNELRIASMKFVDYLAQIEAAELN